MLIQLIIILNSKPFHSSSIPCRFEVTGNKIIFEEVNFVVEETIIKMSSIHHMKDIMNIPYIKSIIVVMFYQLNVVLFYCFFDALLIPLKVIQEYYPLATLKPLYTIQFKQFMQIKRPKWG